MMTVRVRRAAPMSMLPRSRRAGGGAPGEAGGRPEGGRGRPGRCCPERRGTAAGAGRSAGAGAAVAERDELAVELLADARQHLQRQVLLALLDAGDGALAGAEQ